MEPMRHMRRHKSDIALLLFAAVTIVAMLKSSHDPLVPQLQHTLVESWLRQFPTGNQTIFNLAVGVLTAIFTYFLFVRLPEVRKHHRIITHLANTLRNTKVNLICVYLSMVGHSYPAGLPEELLDQTAFRSYFGGDISPRNNRWFYVVDGLNEYWLKEIAAELEILHEELQLALAAVEPADAEGYAKLKSVAAWTIRSRNVDLSSDDRKPLLRALWQLHTGYDFIQGYIGRDTVVDDIESL